MGAAAAVAAEAAAEGARAPEVVGEEGEKAEVGPEAAVGVGEEGLVAEGEEVDGEEGDRRHPRTACPPRSGWVVGGASGPAGGIGRPAI